ncbi:NUDIX hydrolase [Paenibacillus sp. UNC451MF]|uniref:NUDIX hydrolase n=1 Tax=Paenibacillus sp. UNC451MF TaxID=1449063 RepID=UPI000490AA78|nr:NUDIX domain-containing protein [Paenibacillus sp. UNC451MF]
MKQNVEIFDIFDGDMNRIGTATRREVHQQGLWHQTFQCWILSKQDEEWYLLFQMRHSDKDTFPSLLDISCAGHLLAGETVEDGLRELAEELGVNAAFEELHSCGVYREEQFLDGGKIDREFCHVFVLRADRPLHTYQLQEDEVTGLYRIALEDVRRLTAGDMDSLVTAQGVEPDMNGVLLPVDRRFAARDFVPHSKAYFRLVLDTIGNLQ